MGYCKCSLRFAAAEISVASAKGFDYNDTEKEWLRPYYDFSEKHLAWFTYMPLTEESRSSSGIGSRSSSNAQKALTAGTCSYLSETRKSASGNVRLMR